MAEVLTENHPMIKLVTSPQAGNCVLLVCVVNDFCFNNEMSWLVLGHVSVLFIKLQMLKVLMLLCLCIKSEQAQNIGGTSEECKLIYKQVHRL
jgi:hypothetical protein